MTLSRIRATLAQKRQKFMVSSGSLNRGLNCSHRVEAHRAGSIENSFDCLLPNGGVAHDAAFAHFGFPDLELGLDQSDDIGECWEDFNDCRQYQSERNKA